MRIQIASVAAATAVLNYNMLATEVNRVVGYDRVIVSYGLSGSTAIGDFIVEIRVGGKKMATLINTVLGVAIDRNNMLADRIIVARNVEIEAVVVDAANANAVTLVIVTLP